MSTEDPTQRIYSFAEFTLDLDRGALLKNGAEVKLRPKSFQMLRYLVEHNGQLVSKDDLLQAIWANTVVTDDAITQCLIDIRKAIDDTDRKKVRTIPRRGYILEIPISLDSGNSNLSSTTGKATTSDLKRWPLTALLAILTLALAGWWVTGMVGVGEPSTIKSNSAATSLPSIAVLPFVDMSPEQDQQYFGDGIAEELLNLLTRIPGLRVIARTSSFSFKEKSADIAEIARRLKVSHVLEGSVRKSGEQIRITVQLVDSKTSEHIWSETYDRKFGDIFDIQDEISAAVAKRLNVTLLDPARGSRKTDPEAYVLFLRAQSIIRSAGAEISRAESLLRQALKIDPNYVPALTMLGLAIFVQTAQTEDTTWHKFSRSDGSALLTAVVNRALAIEPLDGTANAYLAYKRFFIDNDPSGIRLIERAVASEPNNSEVLRTSGSFVVHLGKWDEAIALGKRAIDLDPLCTFCYFNLTTSYLYAGRLSEAEDLARRNIALNNRGWHNLGTALLLQGDAEAALRAYDKLETDPFDAWTWRHGRALALYSLGRQQEARENLDEYIASSGKYVPRYLSPAQVHAWTGDIDAAFKSLDSLWHEDKRFFRYDFVIGPAWDPLYQNLHEDPRWRAYWEAAQTTPEELQRLELRIDLPALQ